MEATSPEARLLELGLTLPPPPKVMGVYHPALVVGNLVYLSGHGPLRADGTLITGKLHQDAEKQAGYDAARQTGLAMLATLKAHLGSLNRVRRLIKLLGLVNCGPDFSQHPAVINGCSELFQALWGSPDGVAARSAVGAVSLPGQILVEIEAIFELHPS